MAADDAARVRSVLARELDTISEYEAAAREAGSEEIRAFLRHLAREEKEHVAEATALLRRLDADQAAKFAEPDGSLAHFRGEPRRAGPPPAGPAPAGFTVGSLKRIEPT
jgi:phytoene/squalene synthetase